MSGSNEQKWEEIIRINVCEVVLGKSFSKLGQKISKALPSLCQDLNDTRTPPHKPSQQ